MYPIDLLRDDEAQKLMKLTKERREFMQELTSLINRYSLENDSNTPDFIIAEYLYDCLINWNKSVGQRCYWYNPTGDK